MQEQAEFGPFREVYAGSPPVATPATTQAEDAMTSMTTVKIEGAASAQLVRPDVAQTEWLTFPFTALAWGMTHCAAVQGGVQPVRVLEDASPAAIGCVEGLADFDPWRVGGGVAFRW